MPGAESLLRAAAGVEAALAEVAGRLGRVTVQVRSGGRSAGAGVVWLRGGVIVTNAHVATAAAIEVVLADGRALPARVVARGLRAGELVVALGHPLGVAYATALGVVHRVPTAARGPDGWLHADIRLAPGNSGGPLADSAGRVVGINAMIVGGLGIAVPTHVVEAFVHAVESGRRGGARAA